MHVVRFLFLPKWGVVVVVERKGGTRKEREPRAKFSARLVLLFALAMDGFLTSLAGRQDEN